MAPAQRRVVLQARTSSTRLPAKTMLSIAGIPLAVLAARRAANRGCDVVVAIPDGWTEEPLVRAVAESGFRVVRGSLEDVLARYLVAIDDLPDDAVVVRLTADNCFPDGDFVAGIADALEAAGTEYIGVAWPESGLPYGMSAEAFRAGALRRSAEVAIDPYEREHVTPYLKAGSDARYAPADWTGDLADVRCTIDGADDYLRVSRVFADVSDPVAVGWRELASLLEADARGEGRLRPDDGASMVLGTAQLGLDYGRVNELGKPSEAAARELVMAAIGAGVQVFDTARAYGDAERRIGDALVSGFAGGVEIVTKLDPMTDLAPNACEAEVAGWVERSILNSCRDLRLRALPVVLLHRWAHRTSHDGAVWRELLRLRAAGMIGSLGASVQAPAEALAALADPDVAHVQLPVNALDRRWDDAGVPEAATARTDVTVHARSAYLQGLLVGPAEAWPSIEGVDAPAIVASLEALANDLGRAGRADLALAFVRGLPWLDGVVVGVDSVAQLRDNVRLFNTAPLSAEQRAIVRDALPSVPEQLVDPSNWS